MNAQDFVNQDNDRAKTIELLQTFCHSHGLDYEYNDRAFAIKLPSIELPPIETPLDEGITPEEAK